MSRIGLAWRILTDRTFAARAAELLTARPVVQDSESSRPVTGQSESPKISEAPTVSTSGRSDALTLLATLQREARLVDFLKEPIDAYSDAQVGAAVRDIHRDCGKVLERQFAISPLMTEPENSIVNVGQTPDPLRFLLSGQLSGGQPTSGRLLHHGWKASRCELPKWTGTADAAVVIAPAEVELGGV